MYNEQIISEMAKVAKANDDYMLDDLIEVSAKRLGLTEDIIRMAIVDCVRSYG